jgi:hypothetical protein
VAAGYYLYTDSTDLEEATLTETQMDSVMRLEAYLVVSVVKKNVAWAMNDFSKKLATSPKYKENRTKVDELKEKMIEMINTLTQMYAIIMEKWTGKIRVLTQAGFAQAAAAQPSIVKKEKCAQIYFTTSNKNAFDIIVDQSCLPANAYAWTSFYISPTAKDMSTNADISAWLSKSRARYTNNDRNYTNLLKTVLSAIPITPSEKTTKQQQSRKLIPKPNVRNS